ncbi:MAG TPA: chromosome partitioning protein ParB, partial [Accumulibacter sp.]|nr:chromosome partitioning protein ParB [Accumulibacter sp.]
GHARALLPLTGAAQVQLAQRVVQKGLSVRETERLVQYALQPPKENRTPKPDRDILRLQEELADLLGAQVAIQANRRGAGKVLIEFSDLDQLDGILQRLRH